MPATHQVIKQVFVQFLLAAALRTRPSTSTAAFLDLRSASDSHSSVIGSPAGHIISLLHQGMGKALVEAQQDSWDAAHEGPSAQRSFEGELRDETSLHRLGSVDSETASPEQAGESSGPSTPSLLQTASAESMSDEIVQVSAPELSEAVLGMKPRWEHWRSWGALPALLVALAANGVLMLGLLLGGGPCYWRPCKDGGSVVEAAPIKVPAMVMKGARLQGGRSPGALLGDLVQRIWNDGLAQQLGFRSAKRSQTDSLTFLQCSDRGS